jgi:putative N6-adenine-specific DNA methylase
VTGIADRPGRRLVATCARGLEGVLRGELERLGHAEAREGRGMVEFDGDFAAVMRANLWLRSAMRVLVHLADGPAGSREALYRLALGVPWEELIGRGQTFAVEVAGRGDAFDHSGFPALVVKDAIADRLRSRRGERPDVDRDRPDVLVHAHMSGARAGLSLDGTGEPLSHRGWRPRGGPAPLAESLAAGVLLLTGYDGSQPFLDPMCGTGTLAVEAALIATGSAPGLGRSFACERWAEASVTDVRELRAEAHRHRRPARAAIVGSDIDSRAVAAGARNAQEAGVGAEVRFDQRDVRELSPPGEGAIIVANPPYGHRLGRDSDLASLYAEIGDALKRRAAGCTAWILVGDPELAKRIGLRPKRRVVLYNGPIECRLLGFDLVQGRLPARGGAEAT